MVTPTQKKTLETDMRRISKSNNVNVRIIKQVVHVFGTELEVLRLFAHYLENGSIASTKFRVDYSTTYKCHFFTFELKEIACFGLSAIVKKKQIKINRLYLN